MNAFAYGPRLLVLNAACELENWGEAASKFDVPFKTRYAFVDLVRHLNGALPSKQPQGYTGIGSGDFFFHLR